MANYSMHASLYRLPPRKKYSLCSLPLHRKYRSHFEIIASILEIMKGNSATLCSLMEYSCISYTLLKKYLKSLIELGFIEIDIKQSRISYRSSDKGLDFLRQYYILQEILTNSVRNKPMNVV
jgi:predicted transcriptional regulator